jgi:hypothetical protein
MAACTAEETTSEIKAATDIYKPNFYSFEPKSFQQEMTTNDTIELTLGYTYTQSGK